MSDIFTNETPLNKIACNSCKHYHFKNYKAFSCEAFNNIPDEILLGDNMHTKPLKDQGNGIIYEPEK